MGSNAPLAGVRVVDLTRYLAGPFCAQLLGDYGANVVKVEPADPARLDPGETHRRDGYSFMSTNRSKKSLRVDFRKPAGREVLLRLIDSADVLINNYRPGIMAEMGLGYDELKRRNPRLIFCSISGFGSTGPLKDRPGFDQTAQGMSGLMSVTGTRESGPIRVGIAICDLLAGIFAAQGILLALEARHRTGRGQQVETSLLEATVAILTWSAGTYFATGRSPERAGNHHPLASPHGVFMAADRPFNIAVGNDAMWRSLAAAIERPDLLSDPRFETPRLRIANREDLSTEINRTLQASPAEHWIELLNEHGIPAGPILTLEEMFNHPQIAAREMLLRLAHPEIGTFLTTGLPVKLSDTPGEVRRPPLFGEHTDEILLESGLTRDEIGQLRATGIVG